MNKKTLRFNNIKLNKKEFHKSKPIDLFSVDLDEIVSDKFKHNEEGFRYFIGYQKEENVKPLCIILPQMDGYIKYFDNGRKNMSFMIKDVEGWDKCDRIWNAIKDKLDIKFLCEPVHEYKYLIAKVRKFNDVIKTNFLGNDVPKEKMHYTCIACIIIDSVMKADKNYFPQVYLEECKYKIKKIQMSRFIKAELKLHSSDLSDSSDLEAEPEHNTAN